MRHSTAGVTWHSVVLPVVAREGDYVAAVIVGFQDKLVTAKRQGMLWMRWLTGLLTASIGYARNIAATGRQDAPGARVILQSGKPLMQCHGNELTVTTQGPLPVVVALPRDTGFSAVLGKPVNPAQLRQAIGALLGEGAADQARRPARTAPERPPQAFVQAALSMLELGAVSDLIDWADEGARHFPNCGAFMAGLRRLAQAANLQGCRKLLAAA